MDVHCLLVAHLNSGRKLPNITDLSACSRICNSASQRISNVCFYLLKIMEWKNEKNKVLPVKLAI